MKLTIGILLAVLFLAVVCQQVGASGKNPNAGRGGGEVERYPQRPSPNMGGRNVGRGQYGSQGQHGSQGQNGSHGQSSGRGQHGSHGQSGGRGQSSSRGQSRPNQG